MKTRIFQRLPGAPRQPQLVREKDREKREVASQRQGSKDRRDREELTEKTSPEEEKSSANEERLRARFNRRRRMFVESVKHFSTLQGPDDDAPKMTIFNLDTM